MRLPYFVVLCLILIGIMAFIISSFLVYYEVPVQLNVNDVLGFNVGTDELYFGSVQPGGFGHRMIHIKNDRFLFARANIKVYGNSAPWIYVSDNNFYLWKDQVKDVEVKVLVPEDVMYGDYNATLRVYLFLV